MKFLVVLSFMLTSITAYGSTTFSVDLQQSMDECYLSISNEDTEVIKNQSELKRYGSGILFTKKPKSKNDSYISKPNVAYETKCSVALIDNELKSPLKFCGIASYNDYDGLNKRSDKMKNCSVFKEKNGFKFNLKVTSMEKRVTDSAGYSELCMFTCFTE